MAAGIVAQTMSVSSHGSQVQHPDKATNMVVPVETAARIQVLLDEL